MNQFSLEHLNREQQEAVITTDKPVLLLAGAGSGKTRVITYRIAHLISHQGVPAQWILALTFTNKAAKEMGERVKELLGPAGKQVMVTTFHSLCVKILREYIHLLGYTKDFVIFDTQAQQQIVKTIMEDKDMDSSTANVKAVYFEIMTHKGNGETPEMLLHQTGNPHAQMLGKLMEEYNRLLKSCNALDFEDILYKTLELTLRFPQETSPLLDKWHYIMVDEYQDTNRVQYKLVQFLAQKRRRLCVVGDDDQSIYGWRGADIRNILDFQKDFPEAEVIRLEQNYRSTGIILKAANQVIQHNTQRMSKTLWTKGEDGERIKWVHEPDEKEEMQTVVHHMRTFKLYSGKPWSDFAVLYRSNFQSRAVEEALREESIPYQMIGATRFFDRKEIQDCLAYMRFLHNPNDEISLFRIINYPKRGIGQTTLTALGEARVKHGVSLYEVMEQAEHYTDLSPRALESVISFSHLVQEFQARLMEEPFYLVFRELFERLDLKGEIERSEKQEDARERKVNNLLEFINTLYLYGDRKENADLNDFLDYVALFTESDGLDDQADKVSLLTVHSAKGLEFDCVALVGLTDGQFPNQKAVIGGAVEEERRLFYVAITRARKQLIMSAAKERRYYGEMLKNLPSRFLEEVDASLFHKPPFGEASLEVKQQQAQSARADFFARFKNKT